ncbi:MAG: hypothetical protein ACM3SY_09570 [Candidatus Omnitrophota bacterium]
MNNKAFFAYLYLFLLIFFIACGSWGYGQGMDELADKTARSILDYFTDKYNIKTSITSFENFSGISDQAAQKFYQLLVSKLETATMPEDASDKRIEYTDLMINYSQNRGEFNLNRIAPLNHLIYIRLIRNKNYMGAGISIFSRTQDRVVYVKYVESEFVPAEEDILDIGRFNFKGTGFSKVIELEARGDLLDVRSLLNPEGILSVFFYYPERIEIYKLQDSRLIKSFTYKIDWKQPLYPTMQPEGRLCVFTEGKNLYVGVGSNFSTHSKLLTCNDFKWEDATAVDLNFVPFRYIRLNGTSYLAGARYALGRNYFENKLVLAPFSSGQPTTAPNAPSPDILEKQVPPFYALDFATGDHAPALNSIHGIDRDYKYRFLGDNFEQLAVEKEPRGAALCSLNGQWMAISDFSHDNHDSIDKLYFYKIENGSRRLVFEQQSDHEILFISDGVWNGVGGFWVYVKRQPEKNTENGETKPYTEYKLQFWSKQSE